MTQVVNATGQVLEKTTRTRVVQESQSPDFWPYIETLQLPDTEHLLYLYQVRDNRSIPYGQYTSHFHRADGRLISIADREAFEEAVQNRFGGGLWRCILKCGKQRKTEYRFHTGDGPTLPPPNDPTGQGAHAVPMPVNMIPNAGANNPFTQNLTHPQDANVQLAQHAIDTISGQEKTQINIATDLMSRAAETMKTAVEMRMAAPAAPIGPAAELQTALTQAMIARLTQDASTSPAAQLQTALTQALITRLTQNPMDEVRGFMGFFRELGGQSPASNYGAEIVRAVANVVPQAVDGIREWRMGREAERDTAAMMIQPQAPRPAPATFSSPQPATPPMPAPAPRQIAANPAGNSVTPPSTEFVEQRIVEMLRAPISADEAASRTLEFLCTLAGENPPAERNYAAQLAQLGETGLVNLFHMRATLKPATGNMPRLLEFIRAFLKYHQEEQEEERPEQKPN